MERARTLRWGGWCVGATDGAINLQLERELYAIPDKRTP